ncbi:MAG: sulfatase-like hydrolase/transferase [Selenomonadaceae bacterium]|nr:sulfatase-like hydrolase/transferase [Selenomonadaceae bacterium]
MKPFARTASKNPPHTDLSARDHYLYRRIIPIFFLLLGMNFFATLLKALTVHSFTGERFSWKIFTLVKTFAFGAVETAAAFAWIASIMLFFRLIIPDKLQDWRPFQVLCRIGLFLLLFIIFLSRVSEFMFWREFGCSFNFIAVDYLIYTSEMLLNIWQTFHVVPLLLLVLLLTVVTYVFIRSMDDIYEERYPGFFKRLTAFFISVFFTFTLYTLVNAGMAEKISSNRYNQEAAKNDLYSFGAAFLANNLSYRDFYIKGDDSAIARFLREHYSKDGRLLNGGNDQSIRRHIVSTKKPSPSAAEPNVIVVVMESLGKEFLTEYGKHSGLTPVMDKLTGESLYFSNVYATGTRTVRGLEALTLSMPPQAGMSVIRQKDNGKLYNTGRLFKDRGYDVKWVYGGYGYFDNMNEFFSGNGFTIVDRTNIPDNAVTHQTAWGIADEDTFTEVLHQADMSFDVGVKFFQLVLTTSNHSPYTYPEGRVSAPSGSGRLGAVSYADWAIGDFLKRAKEKPWFDSTVFLFIGDHGAASAGKQELNPEKHLVPLIIYAPKLIQPKRVDTVISQIDAIPTLLGAIGFEYDSSFYGENALSPSYKSRYFISNYQYIGYGDQRGLAILKPVRQSTLHLNPGASEKDGKELLSIAINYYQHASRWREFMKQK